MKRTVFLGNLPTWVTADDIKYWITAENLVADSIKVIRNPETQESKGFAFIDVPDENAMNAVIGRFNRAPLDDRLLRANDARPPEPRKTGEASSGHADKQELERVSHEAYDNGTVRRPAESLDPSVDDSETSPITASKDEIQRLNARIEELEREVLALEASLVLSEGPGVRKTIPVKYHHQVRFRFSGKSARHESCLRIDDYGVLWQPNSGVAPLHLLSPGRFRKIWDEFIASSESRPFLNSLRRANAREPDSALFSGYLLSLYSSTSFYWSKEADSLLNEYLLRRALADPTFMAWKLEVQSQDDYAMAIYWFDVFYYNYDRLRTRKAGGPRGSLQCEICTDDTNNEIYVVLKVFERSMAKRLAGIVEDVDPKIEHVWDLSRVRQLDGSSLACMVIYDGTPVKLMAF